jgi:hypothetical protein
VNQTVFFVGWQGTRIKNKASTASVSAFLTWLYGQLELHAVERRRHLWRGADSVFHGSGSGPGAVNSASFGQITSTHANQGDSRTIQFGLKFVF